MTSVGILSTEEILAPAPTLGVRTDRFEFDILDKNLVPRRQINPIVDNAVISGAIDRTIARTLDGLVLTARDAETISPLTDRVRPWLVLQNGERFPLGVYLFGEHQRTLSTRPDTWSPNCYDQGLILEDKTERAFALPAGGLISELMTAVVEEVGISQFEFEAMEASSSEAMAWPAGTERSRIVSDLAAAMGCLTPYFDNLGVLRCVSPPDESASSPQFQYGPGRIWADSIIEADDSFSAPNRYIAIGSGGDEPVVGHYDVPTSAPHSAANRGYIVSETVDVPGVMNAQAARAAARAAYLEDTRTWGRVSFSSPLDPRHDLYALVEYHGIAAGVYMETGFRMQLRSGGEHSHEMSRLWTVDIDEDIH